MAAHGGATESRELRSLQSNRRPRRGAYQHGADGGGGDHQPAHAHCERRLLAERPWTSAHDRHVFESAGPVRPGSSPPDPLSRWESSPPDPLSLRESSPPDPLSLRERGDSLPDGRSPQNDADAGATTRGASAGDEAEG